VAHGLDIEEFWQYIRTVGGNEIDEPGGTWPNLHLSWKPIYTKKCILCADRFAEGEHAYCAFNCPTEALTWGDLEDKNSAISKRLADLKEKGFEINEARPWEETQQNILYAERR
jgi:Fe-S-cluster-containing dehydrogenase component